MATSKHFPVQKYSPRSDSEDYSFNETPYNSVSSFKSYHSNHNRNNSVTSDAPYNYAFEVDNGTSSTPYIKNEYSFIKKSVETNSRHQVPYIDNTVVSAYRGAKPPIPAHKPKISKAIHSDQHSASAVNPKPANTEGQKPKKFGIEHLQSISKQLQNENKEHRRYRNSKRLEEVPDAVARGASSKEDGTQVDRVNKQGQSSQRETGALSPDSKTLLENGRHSSMSRRRLPKVPVSIFQSRQLPNVNTDVDKVPDAPDIGDAEVPDINISTNVRKDSSERGYSLQWDSSSVPKSGNSENNLSECESRGHFENPRNRIARKLEKRKNRDKKRSQSLGDQTRTIAQEAKNMMSDMKENENVFEMFDLDRNRSDDLSSAKDEFTDSEASSQQDSHGSDFRYSADKASDKKYFKNKMTGFESVAVKLKGDLNRSSVESYQKNTNSERIQELKDDLSLQSEKIGDSDFLSADMRPRSQVQGKSHKNLENKPSNSNKVDRNEEDYSIVAALNDIVDNATAELTENLPDNMVFTFDHTVIQELTDSVMGNRECLENAKSEIQECNGNYNVTDAALKRTTSNEDKQIIEGKSFCGNSPKEIEKINNSTYRTSKNKISCDEKLSGNDIDHENEVNDKNKENKVTRVMPQKAKVERSPSYRKKVMARAKSRCKKSSMLKECSCSRNENGEIVICQFCENYENRKRRSKSSLGLETVGLSKETSEFSEGENSDISSFSEISSPRRAFTPGLPPLPSSKSPRPLRKLQVSSRVDVLMSSDLFRKHLNKHETLLQKHTMFRRAGMRKSVSNLDLSEGYVIDSDSQCETESVTSEINFENDANTKDDILSESHDFTQTYKESRRHSLTGDSDMPVDLHKNKKKHFRTLPSSVGRSRPPIPSFTQPKSRPNIPTFREFKVMKELSKSTEALNFEETESENLSVMSDYEEVDSCEIDHIKKQEKGKIDKKTEISEGNKNVDLVPLQLQVIKESHSKENLVAVSNDMSEDSAATDEMLSENLTDKTEEEICQTEKVLIKQCEQVNSNSGQSAIEERENINAEDESRLVSLIERHRDNVDGHEQLTRQQSTPNLKPRQQRIRPKLKSRTLSRLELESECLSDTAGGIVNSAVTVRERRKHGAKRPRSLISKKSSLVSLIQESESRGQYLEDGDSNSDRSVNSRPKLKIGHNVNRSKSDSKYEMGKTKDQQQDGDGNKQPRNLLFVDKGRNTVSFDLDDTSQCSPLDIGESETSTSMAESLSDSIRSEVNAEDILQLPNDQDDTGKLWHDPDEIVADDSSVLKTLKEELVSQVLRSTSDACEITQEAARKRRERKERPYKSDPFSGTEIIPASKRCVLREEKAKLRQRMDFANSSKEEILTFLDGVSHGDIAACDSFPSLEELNEDDEQLQLMSEGGNQTRKIRKHHSNVSSLSTDSGVIGQDGSHDSQQSSPTNTLSHSQSERTMSSWQHTDKRRTLSGSCNDLSKHEIQDCVNCGPQDLIDVHRSQVCAQCLSQRRERKEIIQEIMETELNYGRDLNILKEEFYRPIMKAGLLNKEQLDAIFLNLDELIHVNKHFITKLKSAIHTANQNSDNEFEEVMIGCLFLESSTMFLTFENYCVNQAQAPVLLEQLEREKELLRIFLQVSQNDNHQLRRMHLKSFLMVPVQRIMKYPLLLDRLHKTTQTNHMDKNSLKEAKDKIEDILGHINAKSRTVSFRQRKSSQKSTQHCSVTEKIEVSRVALDTLQWNRKDVCDVITSQLYITQPVDHLWAVKKCKNYKFTTVYGVLLTLMQQPNDTANDNDINIMRNTHNQNQSNNENNNSRVKSAAVVFIKEKSGKYQVMREPFMLEKCVISQDPEFTEVFEILEWSKEAFLIKADTPQETKLWVQNLRQQMNNLGVWRKRRNALPNILLNHLS